MAQPERLDTRVFRGLGWKRRTVMMSRRLAIVALSPIAVLSAPALGWAAEDCVMMDSSPAANAVIARRSSEFFVRFDRPLDHIHKTLHNKRDGKSDERRHTRDE